MIPAHSGYDRAIDSCSACNRFSYGEAEELPNCGHDTGDGADHAYVMVLVLYIAVSIIS